MQSYECVIISKMFLIYFISYGCNDSALVFLGGAEASASPSFALPMFITIKKIIILHLFLGVPAATVGGTGTPWHTRGYAPGSPINCFPSKWWQNFQFWGNCPVPLKQGVTTQQHASIHIAMATPKQIKCSSFMLSPQEKRIEPVRNREMNQKQSAASVFHRK